MQHLNSPNDPAISKRIMTWTLVCALIGFFGGYGVLMFIAWIVNLILK